eukprot:scaffold125226_cov75-Phaeocystis_antarctica.AAC.2
MHATFVHNCERSSNVRLQFYNVGLQLYTLECAVLYACSSAEKASCARGCAALSGCSRSASAR